MNKLFLGTMGTIMVLCMGIIIFNTARSNRLYDETIKVENSIERLNNDIDIIKADRTAQKNTTEATKLLIESTENILDDMNSDTGIYKIIVNNIDQEVRQKVSQEYLEELEFNSKKNNW